MSYVDGFIIAVPNSNKQQFVDYGTSTNDIFIEHGALRVIECWGDDVPEGEATDFYKAVRAGDDESIVFSWIEWPDKETRDKAMEKMMASDFSDERLNSEVNPMPYDGKRMIYGGFKPVVELKGQR